MADKKDAAKDKKEVIKVVTWAAENVPKAADDSPLPMVYCINLKESLVRRSSMEMRFALADIKHQFVEAVTGKSGLVKFYGKDHGVRLKDEDMIRRKIACTASHFKAIRLFLETNEPDAIICEDDICFHKDFHKMWSTIKKNLPANTPLVSLGYIITNWKAFAQPKNGVAPINQHHLYGTQMYWITRGYAIRALEIYDRPYYTPEWLGVCEMYVRDSKGYIARPALAIEEGGNSEIYHAKTGQNSHNGHNTADYVHE